MTLELQVVIFILIMFLIIFIWCIVGDSLDKKARAKKLATYEAHRNVAKIGLGGFLVRPPKEREFRSRMDKHVHPDRSPLWRPDYQIELDD